MKSLFLSGILLLFTGCASYHPKPETPARKDTVKRLPIIKNKPSRKIQKPSRVAVWVLLNREKVSLYFKSIDTGKNLTVILEKGLNQKSIPAGHWELTGFASQGKSFNSMNTTKKFVFRMKKKTNSYAGSLVLGCPQISSQDNQYLKGMRFFNRYPFSSIHGLCEIIVGNDFAEVRDGLRKARKNKNLELTPGF